jgi:hypothetical protein
MPDLPLPDNPSHLRDIIRQAEKVLEHSSRQEANFNRVFTFARFAAEANDEQAKQEFLSKVRVAEDLALKNWEPAPSHAALLPFIDIPQHPSGRPPAPLESLDEIHRLISAGHGPWAVAMFHLGLRHIFQGLLTNAMRKLSIVERWNAPSSDTGSESGPPANIAALNSPPDSATLSQVAELGRLDASDRVESLRARLELILAVFDEHGPGPFRGREIAELAQLESNSDLRSDLSELKGRGYLTNDGSGYRRTDKPYRCQ